MAAAASDAPASAFRALPAIFDSGKTGSFGALTSDFQASIKQYRDESEIWNTARRHAFIISRLFALESLQSNWDSFGAPAPSSPSISLGRRLLNSLSPLNIIPHDVLPSAGGGITFIFVSADRYSHVELRDNGKAFSVSYSDSVPPAVAALDSSSLASLVEAVAHSAAFVS